MTKRKGIWRLLVPIGLTTALIAGCTSGARDEPEAERSSAAADGKVEVDCDAPELKDPNSTDPMAEQCARQRKIAKKREKVFYQRKFDLSGLESYKPEHKVSGTIRQWGNNYLADSTIAKRWEGAFRKYHPGVKFEDNLTTSAVGIPGLYTGRADLAPMGREMLWDENQAYQRQFNGAPIEITMATGSYDVAGWTPALGVWVSDRNPLRKLTFEQLDGVFGAARTGGWNGLDWNPKAARGPEKNIRTWGQLGLTGKWKNKPINVYGYTSEYHFGDFFSQKVLGGSSKYNENIKEYVNQAQRDGSLASAGDLFMKDLAADPYGIAYAAITYRKPGNKAVALSAKPGAPFVEPTIDTIQNRSFPLARSVYYYLTPGKLKDPKTKEFLRFVLSREGQQIIQADGKYLPLTAELAREQLQKIS
ncbi:PstS family phosphate ABC transporter substrate-binding protein [Streptomyces scopuliridis]|uniref:PstS family phosphate ABC transporter substrate-binding protein n=1 Tax=Streptomyces scopuliridis TaxID=452529 RepID=UPI0036AFF5CD